jgi:hypothetical protein
VEAETGAGFTAANLLTGLNTIILDVPLDFEVQSALDLFLIVQGMTTNTFGPTSVTWTADFSHTVTLTSAQILSGDKQVLLDGQLVSAGSFSSRQTRPQLRSRHPCSSSAVGSAPRS